MRRRCSGVPAAPRCGAAARVGRRADPPDSSPPARARAAAAPSQDFASPAYLFPDSSDRTTCVALIPAWQWTRTPAGMAPATMEYWLRTGLGPCAFYAVYGAPGRGVREWLARRGYDLARVPLWDRDRAERPQDSFLIYQDGTRWWWRGVRSEEHTS